MTDIIVRTSDGRVMDYGSISLAGDRYIVVNQSGTTQEPLSSFGFSTSLIANVAGAPDDIIGGWNYDYVGGVWTPTGLKPPLPPIPGEWSNKATIANGAAITVIVTAIGSPAWARIENDPAGAGTYSEIMATDPIDPTQPTFQNQLAYLQATKGADGQPLLTPIQITNINAGWPNKT